MVESRPLGRRRGVGDDEFETIFDRFPVPETVGIIDPNRPFGDIINKPLELFSKSESPVIIGLGHLAGKDCGKDDREA